MGESAFATKAGIHASAIIKDPATYEHVAPEQVGNKRKLLVSDQSGRSNLLAELDRIGFAVDKDDPRLSRLLDEVKEREAIGYAYETADASFELLARRLLGKVPRYFDVEKFDVTVEQRISAKGERVTVSMAVVKVKVGDEVLISVAEGNGPVNALDIPIGSRPSVRRHSPSLSCPICWQESAALSPGHLLRDDPGRLEISVQKACPNVLERLRRHRSVAHGIRDRGMPEVMLKPARIHAAPRQCVSGRMPQHVDVYRERQPSNLASPFNHASNAHTTEGLTALIDEHVSPLGPVSLSLPLQELETVHLIALQVMDAVRAALEPARDNGALWEVDVIPAQITGLRDAQTVAVDNQSHQPIPVTVPVTLEGGQQPVHLGLGQMLPDPVGIVPPPSLRSTGRIK